MPHVFDAHEEAGAVLDAARAAARQGDDAIALQHYEWFFDHALDHDPASFYGVRLSYCLGEWAQLGQRYVPAMERLQNKAQEALQLLEATRNPERFHDYLAICGAMDEQSELPLRKFLELHARDRELASSAVRFIWHELIEHKEWDIAAAYITDYRADYERALTKFEQAMFIGEQNPDFGGGEFAEQVRGWCVQDLGDLWLVLTHAGKPEHAEDVKRLALADPRLRRHPTVGQRAFAAR